MNCSCKHMIIKTTRLNIHHAYVCGKTHKMLHCHAVWLLSCATSKSTLASMGWVSFHGNVGTYFLRMQLAMSRSTWQIHHLSLGRSKEDHEIPKSYKHSILGLSSNPRRVATVWNFLMQLGEAMTVVHVWMYVFLEM